jgi:hypothetical protein
MFLGFNVSIVAFGSSLLLCIFIAQQRQCGYTAADGLISKLSSVLLRPPGGRRRRPPAADHAKWRPSVASSKREGRRTHSLSHSPGGSSRQHGARMDRRAPLQTPLSPRNQPTNFPHPNDPPTPPSPPPLPLLRLRTTLVPAASPTPR